MNIQQSYRESAVRGASPVELVMALYEQMIKDLRQVEDAIDKKDIALRTNHTKHAILVVGHLQSTLDFERGDKVARNLENFYNTLRQSLITLQFHPSKRDVEQIIIDLFAVRDAWMVVASAERPETMASVVPAPTDFSGEMPRMEWEG